MDTVEAYDPGADTWTSKAPMPTARAALTTCVVDGIIYAIGGYPSALHNLAPVEAYDPRTDTWTSRAPMPTPRYLLGAGVVGRNICAIGGYRHSLDGPVYSTVEVYDPQTDTWMRQVVDIPAPTAGLSINVVEGRIYAFGGTLATHVGNHWVFTSAVYASEVVVDFNGDELIDLLDLEQLISNWGTDDQLYDIGPMAWGDGVVDIEDLKVLARYIGEELDDPTLMAHWALDEAAGMVAHDSAGVNDGLIIGLATWQPDGGKINGALEFTGADFVTADSPLSPDDGCFSILAWVKGGAPGQVVLSQSGVDWLMADSVDGTLMIQCGSSGPLCSEASITDGTWHRIAFTSDGSHRILYVDDQEVARDVEPAPQGTAGRLLIGTGKTFSPGTYWTGLIDDVRIYSRAVKP